MARKNKTLDDGAAENAVLETEEETAAAITAEVEDGAAEGADAFTPPLEDGNNGCDEATDVPIPDSLLSKAVEQEEWQSPGSNVGIEAADPHEAEEALPEIRFLGAAEEDVAASDAELIGAASNDSADYTDGTVQ